MDWGKIFTGAFLPFQTAGRLAFIAFSIVYFSFVWVVVGAMAYLSFGLITSMLEVNFGLDCSVIEDILFAICLFPLWVLKLFV